VNDGGKRVTSHRSADGVRRKLGVILTGVAIVLVFGTGATNAPTAVKPLIPSAVKTKADSRSGVIVARPTVKEDAAKDPEIVCRGVPLKKRGFAAMANARSLCPVAVKIGRDFLTSRGLTRHGGPSSAETWYTLKRFPGWRCGTGTGGGGCSKGQARVGWQLLSSARLSVIDFADSCNTAEGCPRLAPSRWLPSRSPRLGLGVGFYGLKWTGWGGAAPAATGEIRVCVQSDCSSHNGQIRLAESSVDQARMRIVYGCLHFLSVPGVPELDGSWARVSADSLLEAATCP
jgi:hypothetical protein